MCTSDVWVPIIGRMPLDTEKIEAVRKKLRLTQEGAAKKAGLAGRQHWNNIVNGNQGGITLTTLEKIAKALKVKARDLLK